MDISLLIWPLVVPGITVFLFGIIFLLLKHLRINENIDQTLPYKIKRFFFSRSEQEFFNELLRQLDTSRFLVFPKVRLADFIEVTSSKKEYQKWWNKIKAKHIDFLIWDMQQNKIVLAIELDGKSHESKKMQVRDEFVDGLYKIVGIRLERVGVGDNFDSICEDLRTKM